MKALILLVGLSIFLTACGQRSAEPVADTSPKTTINSIIVSVEPPKSHNSKTLNMQQQTAGTLSLVRNELDSKGFSLTGCTRVKAYVRGLGDKPADMKGFIRAYNKVFGTRLIPNKPQMILVEVKGFANPEHLLLLEVECKK